MVLYRQMIAVPTLLSSCFFFRIEMMLPFGRRFNMIYILLLLLIMLPAGSFSPIFSCIENNSNSKVVVGMLEQFCNQVRNVKMRVCFGDLRRKNKRNKDKCLRKANEQKRKCCKRMSLRK